jgi:hypothetical protein
MNPRYNSRHPMTKSYRHWSAAVVAVVLALCAAGWAADWTQPSSQLARDVVAITGPGAASISYRNQSSLPNDQTDAIRRTLENQLRAGGVRLAPSTTAAAEIRITFSENAQGYLWVAEVQQGSETRVAMVSVERPAAIAMPSRPASMSLRKTLLWSQPTQILDLAVVPAGSEPLMLVLDPSGVTIYKKSGSTWNAQQTLAIPRETAWPRDLRGRIAMARDHMFDVFTPGVACNSTSGSTLALNCRQGDDPWPLAPNQSAFFAPARNFYTGVLTPAVGKQGSVPPFFSAAALARPRYTLWVFARTDATVHAFDGLNDIPLRTLNNSGSDLATVNSGCGSGTQLLVTSAVDTTVVDTVRVFEVADRDALEAAPAINFAGPITALWPAADGHTAVAVARNLKTERYDAFEIAINCAQ